MIKYIYYICGVVELRIKICADSACDLPKELLAKHDIDILPITVIVEEKAYRDGLDITAEQMLEITEKSRSVSKTAAINTEAYIDFFGQFAGSCDALVFISISSGLSACYQNAVFASKNFSNVYVIDSLNLSTGIGHIVLDAAEMAEAGAAPEEIVKTIEKTRERVEASFVINTIKYLYRGGRCSSLAALGANLLNLKPCIEVQEGRMSTGKKYRGNYAPVILKYVEDRLAGRTDIDTSRLFITHSPCPPGMVRSVRDAIDKYQKFDEVIESSASSTIACHCGLCTIGILFKRKA